MSTSPRPWTLVASVLLHIAIIALLLWGGFQTAAPKEQAPLALELWTTAPAPPAVEATPVAKPVPQPEAAEPPPPPAEVNLGRHQPEAKIEHKKPEPKPPEPKKPEPAKKEAPKPEPAKPKPPEATPPRHAAKPAKAYNPEADDLLASLDSTRASGKGNARQDAAGSKNGVAGGAVNGSSAAMGGWISRVRAKVTPLVQVPPDITGNPKAVVQVTLLPSLEVNKVQLLQGSGSKAYDEAVQRAIWEAKTFPSLPAGAQFNDGYRQFKMEFRPRQ